MQAFDPEKIREQFPALNQTVEGVAPIFFDGPGGTQVPGRVMKAMADYLSHANSNLLNSPFFGVQNTHKVVNEAREHAAAFFNAPSPKDIVFGANMSTITAHMSRSISREWNEGDEIILTGLDHYANVSYWRMAAQDRGVKVHVVNVLKDDCTLDYKHLESLISKKTKFVAFTMASNVCGSLTDVARVVKLAKQVGAMTYADAVHYAPHFLPDVQALGCDFMACSPYKFYGPHLGMLYGKSEHLRRLTPYKVELAASEPPECWETGTKSFEALAGFNAQIDYLASLGEGKNLREKLQSYYARIGAFERNWAAEFIKRASTHKGLTVHGITDLKRLDQRTATFAVTLDGVAPQVLSDHLARHFIATGAGHFYGKGVTDAIGVPAIVRIGCVHYNTFAEMDRFFEVLGSL